MRRELAAAAAALAASIALLGCGTEAGDADMAEVTTWKIDRSGPPQSAAGSTIRVLVEETNCNGGQPPERERIQEPAITYEEDAITVTYSLVSSRSIATCEASPPARVDLVLDEPLGDRVLLDGGRPDGQQQIS